MPKNMRYRTGCQSFSATYGIELSINSRDELGIGDHKGLYACRSMPQRSEKRRILKDIVGVCAVDAELLAEGAPIGSNRQYAIRTAGYDRAHLLDATALTIPGCDGVSHQASIASRPLFGAAECSELQVDVLCSGGDQVLMDRILSADARVRDLLRRV